MSITIRNASAEDLDRVMAVEESWPEVARAPRGVNQNPRSRSNPI